MTEERPSLSRPPLLKRVLGQFSLRQLLWVVTWIALVCGNAISITRMRRAESALADLRSETGYLSPTSNDQIAALRAPSDTPLSYVFRVRIPATGEFDYRIAYSTLLPKGKTQPDWYAMIAVRPGESLVTIRIAEDPRDERWKISTLVRDRDGVRRIGTTLPDSHTAAFRTSTNRISTGLDGKMVVLPDGSSMRLLDDRWLVGDKSLLLSGDKPVTSDQIGVYAELQPIPK